MFDHRYILFYKPYNVLCQFTQTENNTVTLKDYINLPAIYPVGRLDQDSEGLLLLTDDGRMQHHLTDPRFHHPKTYWVQVEGSPAPAQLEQLQKGVLLNFKGRAYRTLPAQVSTCEPNLPDRVPSIRYRAAIPTTWLEITLTEGKNRQIRRMTAHVGLPTLRLVRVKIGSLTIDGLQPGQWRQLSPPEVKQLNFTQNFTPHK